MASNIYHPIEGDVTIRELFTGKFQVSRYKNKTWKIQPTLIPTQDALDLSSSMQEVHTISEDYHVYRPHESNALLIPVEPVSVPCSECGSETYPNFKYELVGLSGVLCKPCLEN
jgi:hypothetical protein